MKSMTFDQALAEIDKLAANHWKQPVEAVA